MYFNYLGRPLYNASIDGKASRSLDPYPETGGSAISGVALATGIKKVTWVLDGPAGAPGNGETIHAKNSALLDGGLEGARYLGVHIYPDATVELIPSRHYPRPTEKGIALAGQSKQ
ncbi:hypothetical protein GCM10007387_58470 [Pseudoduganella albidiflava]|uniref:Uncharacterized protein n=1 Tax=Pseudoduganella albidiflava TaxID=321983 RepID=A0AA87XYC5_9BURK|nr:hypothetical protein GCM10007387_58470 [Pseudoduganella albidiflava]